MTTKAGSSSVTRHVTEEDDAAEHLSSTPPPRVAEVPSIPPATGRLYFTSAKKKPSATRGRRERQNTEDNCHTGLKGPRKGLLQFGLDGVCIDYETKTFKCAIVEN